MTALVSYSTGTISIAAGGTTATGVGTIWSGTNVRPGDILQIGNFQTVISDVTDTTHLVVPPWGGGAQSGVSYKIWQVSPQRFAGAQAMQAVNDLVAALDTSGFFVFVSSIATVPDPSLGDDGQYALQPTTGKVWLKIGGVWTVQPALTAGHLVVYTVAPSTASDVDKVRADFVADGVNDQVAIEAAFAAAGNSNSAVTLLPGAYTFGDTCTIPAASNCVLYAEGTTITGPGGTKDTFYSPSMIRCNYYFGSINHSGTGSAFHAVQFANGSWITAQSINGIAHQGKGIYVDASTTGSSTGYIRLGWLHGFDKGIHFYSKTVIDTHVVWLNYGFDCHWVIYDETDVGASLASNGMTWNVNLDTQWAGSAAYAGIWTNGHSHVINGTIGSTVGGTYGPNIKLDTAHGFAADAIFLNLTPPAFAHEAGNVVNTSGNNTHFMPVGFPVSLATGGVGNKLAKWSGSNVGQIDNTGIELATAGTSGRVLYFSSTGIIGEKSTTGSGSAVLDTGASLTSPTFSGNVGFGDASPQAAVVINKNATAGLTPAAFAVGMTTEYIVGQDGNNAGICIDIYGSGAFQGFLTMRTAQGSAASPAALTSASAMGQIAWCGHNGSSFTAQTAAIVAAPSENWTASHNGTYIDVYTTPTGTASLAKAMRINPSGCLGVGSSANDNGAGNITATGGIQPGSFTVAGLPAGVAGKMVWCSNCRVFNGAGTQEGAGVGSGGLVTYNGTAWKIAGTNVTAVA
jgi:hypothetical protein